jgi:EAL and modified HD-GYP domain-containing signal transduction protein
LVEVCPVANAHNEWVALLLRGASEAIDGATLQALFGTPDLLEAVAPLDCIVLLDSPAVLTPSILALLPPHRVLLAVCASALEEEGAARRVSDLQRDGFRFLLDGAAVPAAVSSAALPASHGVARDCSAPVPVPVPASLPPLSGPRLAYGVDSAACFQACAEAGFDWFSGDYALTHLPPQPDGEDCSTRKRLLTLLALLARDADVHDLEHQLKQDPALSYHLLKLVNSAAFTCGVEISSFAQAIGRIGRRQLQRWLQLLLYARQHPDGPPNLLLPLAALRGATLEALCKRDGGDRDAQDMAFMAGVFSLLDRLFPMPMAAIVAGLPLPRHVEAALLRREGLLGQRLRLAACGRPDPALLDAARVEAGDWWQARLHAYHWAIQVARNV